MKFHIMRRTPLFVGVHGHEVTLSGRKGELLRLLLLMEGKPLTKEEIGWHMPTRRSTQKGARGRPTAAATIEGYAGLLRDAVGEDMILTVGDGYQSAASREDVDAYLFAEGIEECGVMETWSVEEADEGFIDRLDDLLQLKSMWQANPAQDYSESQLKREFCEAYWEFEQRYRRLWFAIVYTYLRRATPPDIRAAITYLQAMAAHLGEDTDNEVWQLLLRAQGSVPSYHRDLPGVLKNIKSRFGEDMPLEISDVYERVIARDPSILFGVEPLRPSRGSIVTGGSDSRRESGAAEASLVQLAREIGLSVEGSSLRLQGSRAEPIECIDQTVRTLFFEGILASKWVEVSAVRNRFDALLTRLDNEGGEVKFLLIDPESASYERFRELREGNEGLSSLPHLIRLVEGHPSFEVRLYDALPAFRIVIIDHDVMTVSPYLLAAEDYLRGHYGWDAPHAAFDPFAPWSFAKAFEVLFLEQWRTARPIDGLKIRDYENLGSPGKG